MKIYIKMAGTTGKDRYQVFMIKILIGIVLVFKINKIAVEFLIIIKARMQQRIA